MRDRGLAAFLFCLCFACEMPRSYDRPDVHGHRGCRGLMPENTVQGFIKALELGCDWLEMDVVVSADSTVIVSHEPWMSAAICLDRNGAPFGAEHERLLNIHKMTTADIALFDCGTKPHPHFPSQQHHHATKPTLDTVVAACDAYAAGNMLPEPRYNIEIKSDPLLYGEFQPYPDRLASTVVARIAEMGIGGRCMVQSFDPAVLQHVRRLDPDLTLALLVEKGTAPESALNSLGFDPDVYSPSFELVNDALVAFLDQRDIPLVVWTVNEEVDIRRMLDLGVDGIISDYPDRVIAALDER